MGLIVSIHTGRPEGVYGLLVSVEGPEWRVRIDQVPRVALFSYGNLIAVTADEPHRFLRILERGSYQTSLCVSHSLSDDAAVGGWLDELEKLGWHTRDQERGAVWVAAPQGVDMGAVLSTYPFVLATQGFS